MADNLLTTAFDLREFKRVQKKFPKEMAREERRFLHRALGEYDSIMQTQRLSGRRADDQGLYRRSGYLATRLTRRVTGTGGEMRGEYRFNMKYAQYHETGFVHHLSGKIVPPRLGASEELLSDKFRAWLTKEGNEAVQRAAKKS